MVIYYILGTIFVILIIACICFYPYVNLFLVATLGKKRIQKNIYKSCKVNDFLTISDIYLLTEGDHINHIDTIIFGNKYIYIVYQVLEAGEIKVSLDDNMWRVIYNKKMTTVKNPLLHNKKVINKLANSVQGLEISDMKSIAVVCKTCSLSNDVNTNDEYVVSEKKLMQLILDIEKNSDVDIIDPYEIERYAKAFYEEGLKTEKLLRKK